MIESNRVGFIKKIELLVLIDSSPVLDIGTGMEMARYIDVPVTAEVIITGINGTLKYSGYSLRNKELQEIQTEINKWKMGCSNKIFFEESNDFDNYFIIEKLKIASVTLYPKKMQLSLYEDTEFDLWWKDVGRKNFTKYLTERQ